MQSSLVSAGQVPDARLVRALLASQAPQFAHLPVRSSASSGSSNWVFRLGEQRAVRLPRSDAYVAAHKREVSWLPQWGSRLSVPVPEVLFVGSPGEGFSRPWSVMSWVPGETPGVLVEAQQARFAQSLGEFLGELHALSTDGEIAGADSWGYRCGEPVTDEIDSWAEEAAVALSDLFNPDRVREAWRRLRDVPAATGPACWVHTDVSAENVLVRDDGSLAGVIDFGGVGVGDRSIDFLYAWSMLDAPARETLRAAAQCDDETWVRARAWAFAGPGLLTLAHYRQTMPERRERLIRMVEAVAAEVGVALR